MLLLIVGGIFCIGHIYFIDSTILLCLAKTFIGDTIAGKIDTSEWKSAVFFTFCSILLCFILEINIFLNILPLFIIMSLIQLITELGDNYLESYLFFRHRYSFELMTLFELIIFDLNIFAK